MLKVNIIYLGAVLMILSTLKIISAASLADNNACSFDLNASYFILFRNV